LRSMKAVEFSPQFASVISIEQSDAARAKEPDIKLGNPAISATVATLHNHIVATCYAIQPTGRSAGSGGSTQTAREIEGDPAIIYVYIPVKTGCLRDDKSSKIPGLVATQVTGAWRSTIVAAGF
jgi:hypothetical protein